MKDFFKAFAAWWDDPMTQKVFAGVGAALLIDGISRAVRLAAEARADADHAHERIDAIERTLPVRTAR